MSGHGFSRATKNQLFFGLQPLRLQSQGLKPRFARPCSARLKTCPDTGPNVSCNLRFDAFNRRTIKSSASPAAPDPIPHARMDGTAAIFQPPAASLGLRRNAPPPPSHTPSTSGQSDRNAAASAIRTAGTSATRIALPASFSVERARRFRHSRPLRCQTQTSRHFADHFRERHRQHALARVEHNVHRPLTGQ